MASLIKVRGEDGQFIDLPAFVGPHYTPSLSSDGELSWTNNSDLPNPPSVNIKGPQGDPYTHSEEFSNLAAQVADDARNADASAQNAKEYEESARRYFLSSSDNATASYNSAQRSEAEALAAKGYKEGADAAANQAFNSKTDAEGYANRAAASEANSLTNANTAKGHADDANRYRESAGVFLDETKAVRDQAEGFKNASAASATQSVASAFESEVQKNAAKTEADRAKDEADRAGAAAAGAVQSERMRNDSQDAQIANLAAAALGKLYREEVDDTDAYIKAVPAGALPYAAVTELGSADVDGVIYTPAQVLSHGVNLLANVNLYGSKAVSSTDGTLTYSNTRYSGYVNVSAFRGKTITYSWKTTSTLSRGMAFYDENKVFVLGKKISTGATVTVPDNAVYARFTFAVEEYEAIPMVVLGDSIPDPRVPPREPDSFPVGDFPIYVPVETGGYLSFENDKGEMIPLPGSVTYAINVQEAIANE